MPLRRGFGGVSSGAGGNLFDRPGFFDYSEIVNLTVDTKLLLKAANETYGIAITHASTANNAAEYNIEIPDIQANDEFMLAGLAQTLTNKTLASPKIITGIYDANGNELLLVTATSSAVNELTLANAATGNPPILSATGGDTNIGITLTPKGSGVVRITGGLTVDGTTTTLNSTTLSVDDKNIEMGSVASPSDSTADGGGITLKGATDKTIIWDNTNDNWTSNQDWNIASGKSFKINNAVTLNATTLGSAVVTSSLTTVGTLGSGAISSGFGNVDIGTSVLTAGQLNIDNIRIDGNTISSTSGQILFDATTTLDFGDDSVLNIGTLTIDAIHGDNNAIQVGDNSDDAVSIYRVNALTAIANLDIGANDFRAGTITADGLTAGRVVFAGTNGVLSDDSDLTFATATLTATNIAAFNLTGKLTAGSTEIEGSNFDINGGAIDGVTIGTNVVATEIRVDNLTLNGNTISTTDTNGAMVLAPHGTGDVQLDADTVRIGDANALALITTNGTGSIKLNTNAGTNSGHIQINAGADGAIDITPNGSGDVNITNVDIGSGNIDGTTLGAASAVTISGATIGGALTWSAAQNLNNQNLTNVDIDSGTINDITTFGIKQDATSYEMQIAVGATTLTADRVLAIDPKNAARTITLTGNLTLAGDFITSGAYATTLTTTGTTGVTLPTTGTLATLAGNETLTNKALTQPAIGNFTSATHTHANAAGGGTIPSSSLSSDVALGSQTSGNYVATITGGTGITSSAATSGEGTTHTLSIDASQGQITTVGALNAGSITSGFTSIDVGSGAISSTGTVTTGALVVGGDVSTAAAQDWDLLDNNASALSFDAAGKTGILEIDTRNSAERVTMSGDLLVSGDLRVSGTTTTVDSTVLTVVDPIITLQTASGGGALSGDSDKDVGLAMQYYSGSAKTAFLGYDDSAGKLTFIPDATLSSEVVSGSIGTLVANLEGAVTGNASTATEATNVTAVANNSTNETVYLTFIDGATGTQGVETDTGLTYNPSTGVVTAGSFAGVVTGTAETATALANPRTIGMTGDVVWTSASFDGTANVTGASTIQTNAVQAAMVHEDVISGRTELTSGVATDADFLLLWDATDSVFKKVKPDNLGVSGLAVGGSHQLQYASGTAFAGASNVQIKNAALALKEMSTPNAESGYGLIYAKSDNELYYRNDTNAEVKLTFAGAMAGGGAFRGIKAYLTANNTIGTGSSVTPTAWTESYDVGGFHVASGGTENRFTFGVIGYYEIKIQQEWAADAAGYREMSVERVDVSASTHDGIILRDRADGSSQATVSGSSTVVYIDDAADYVKVNLYQNSGADLVATGNNDDSTAITISRVDMATSISQASGASGRVQFSDGSGNFTSDSDLTFVTDTLSATNLTSSGLITGADLTVTGTSTTIGTVTSGVWNAGAVTSAGTIKVTASSTTATGVLQVNASDDGTRFAVHPVTAVGGGSHTNFKVYADAISLTGSDPTTYPSLDNVVIDALTYNPANSNQTATTAATFRIVGPPLGSPTFTNGPYALHVDAGNSRFDGNITSSGTITSNNLTTASGNLSINAYAGSAIRLNDAQANVDVVIESDSADNLFYADAGLNTLGFWSVGVNSVQAYFEFDGITMPANTSADRMRLTWGAPMVIPSGTTALAGTLNIEEPNLTATGTVTNAYTVRINNAPSEGSTGNYALWVAAGTSRFDGNIEMAGANPYIVIDGSASAALNIDRGVTSDDAKIRYKTAGSTQWEVGMDSSGGALNAYEIKRTNNATPDFMIDTSGRVGIGAAPSGDNLLTVSSSNGDIVKIVGTGHAHLRIDGANSSAKQIKFDEAGTTQWYVGMENSPGDIIDDFVISGSNNPAAPEFIIKKSSGNVGIGTATPGTDFAVTSGGDYTGTYDKTLEIAAGGNASSRAFLLLQGKTDSSIIFGNSTNDANDRKAGIVYTGGNLTFGKVEDADKAIDAANVAMSIDTSTGKVGIGVTPSGDNNLEVYKASGANAQARIHAQGNAAILILDSDVGGVSGSVGDSHIQFRNNNSTLFSVGVDDSDDDKFKISTSAIGTNDRFIIDSSGNITMTENLALTDGELTVTNSSGQDNTINAVSGASGRHAWFRSANNANTVNLKMGATRTSNEGNIPANVALILASGSANPDLYFMTNNTPQQAMIIKGSSGGHVGIGVSPTTKFHVNGAVASNANLAYFFNSDMGDASHTSIWIGKAKSDDQSMGIGYYYDTTTADSYAWFGLRHGDTPGTHTINVKSGGYVGIGISPSERLHVNGNFIASGSGTLGSATITPGSTTATHSLRVNANDDAIRFSVSPSRSIARATDHAGVSIGGDGISVTGDAGGTATNWTHVEIGALNYLPANATQTITNAATLKIVGPPTASGGGVTFTNGALALWVDAGNSRFDGNITLQGPSHTSLIINAAASSNADLLYQIDGSRVWNAGCTSANLRYTISDAVDDDNDGVYMSQGATSWTANTSDERKKTNWIPFTNALDKLATLTKLGTYQRKNPTTNELKSEIRHVGVSAQEIKEILPEAVDETLDPNDGETYLSLRYQDVFVLMLKAIQELKAEIDILKAA